MDAAQNDITVTYTGDDVSSITTPISPNHQPEKPSALDRKTGRRSKNFKFDKWYEKAALTVTIKTKQP
jgi:hypothetical protein